MSSQTILPLEPGFNFSVTVSGVVVLGQFMAIEGLGQVVETEEYFDGGGTVSQRFIKQARSEQAVTLKWGLVSESGLYDWMQLVQVGGTFRKDVTIYHYGHFKGRYFGAPVRTYLLHGAFPTKWTAANLNSNSPEIPMESLELVYKYMTVTITPP